MIRKLRRKFILINMLLVSVVLLAVFLAFLGSTVGQQRLQSENSMRMALRWSEEGQPRFEVGPRPEIRDEGKAMQREMALVPVFTVTVENGAVTKVNDGGRVEVSGEVAAQAVQKALEQGMAGGTLSGLGLRYLREDGADGVTRIAFADRSWESAAIRNLVGLALLVGLGALVGFFAISLFLSRIAIRPVKQAWEQQQRFVADASHELKTPLTVILADVNILLAHREERLADQEKWVEYIREEALRMQDLVEDMLFLAKSDEARCAANAPERFCLSEFSNECLLPFEPVAFEKGVALESRVEPELYVRGDREQLRRLLLILLDNACKYAGSGGAAELTLERRQEKLRLSVRNTGVPIPAEHLGHLFERFYRVDGARSREDGGYGLGLAIARSIVEAHRGKISVTSDLKRGTVFTVVLPADG